MPSNRQLNRFYKPLCFLICLLPLASLVWRGFGVGGSDLGVNPVEMVLDTFGNWGLRMLVLTLAVTPLRNWLGLPWLIAFRRMLGLFAFFYVCMHFLTWLVLDQGLYLAGIGEDIAKRPFITLGFTALLLLLPLAATSTNGMMRRLGRRWSRLHRLVYLIVLLGIWHFWWQVKADFREPLIYLLIVGVLLGWRLWRRIRAHARQYADRPLTDGGLVPALHRLPSGRS